MTILRLLLLVSLLAFAATCQQRSPQQTLKPPASCPVTVPPASSFAPPSPYPSEAGEYNFWLGTEKLWTILPKSGVWWGWKPHEAGQENRVHPLTEKTGWGSVDFDLNKEPYPDLKVTGRRLDGDAPPLVVDKVTNALFVPHAAMLTGVIVPAPGCWEITGDYKGQKLSFVVWVYPVKQGN